MMSNFKLNKIHKEMCDSAFELMKKKNADYTGKTGDPYYNFRQAESMGICTAEEGIIIRMMDKLSRVKSFLDTGILNVTDESIDDTMVDIVNYTALLRGMIDERKEVSNVE